MNKRIKVNFIIDFSNALKGSGIYSSATRLAQGLKELGFDISINSNRSADIVHFHTALPQSCIKAYMYRSFKSKTIKKLPKIVIHGHTTIEDFVNSFIFSNQIKPFLKHYLPFYYNLADKLIAVSDHNKNLLVNYGINQEKIEVISNGIKTDSAKINNKLRILARKELGLSEKDTLVIGLGVSIYRKGIDIFVKIAEKLPNVQFIWIGKRIPTSFLAHSSYLKKCFKLANNLPNIKFAGYVSRKTLISVLNSSDIFLFPTREENQGIAFLEAILYGKPAIISNHPVFSEYEDKTHVLKANNLEDYVNHINYLINNKDIRMKLVKNARSYLDNHEIKLSINRVSDVYSELISDSKN
ncbi:MAG: Processive diacylglycerol alpha-glucosyltransferase [Candidatus Heimdallarchaeota archaeon LC_3]|nr:MAG: Processive diacylglycerol alpha-glucosyltransferase [Candidatus Heimdallarchaeota archaeon LC_3]